jgi:hypothetical protein
MSIPKFPLVGGSAHGQSVKVDKKTDEIDVPIHSTDEPVGQPLYNETYERRHFDGEGFGEGFDCFAVKSDDVVEQKELARWTVSHTEES